MGQGGHITIINNTDSKMTKTYIGSYQMEAWNFPDEIQAGERKRVYVEWCDNIFKCTCDDRGTVIYALASDMRKTLRLTMFDANTRSMSVELTGIAGPGVVTSCPIQWRHDGEMYIFMDDRMDLSRWMEKVPGNTPVNSMDIPGTHDSLSSEITGTVGSLAPSSARTQKMKIWDQLSYGSRFFDIRIDENLNGCHGMADCRYNLRDALEAMNKFLERNETEAIFMRITNERPIHDKDAFTHRMDAILAEYGHLFWKNNTENWPQLDDVRGKIVVFDCLDGHYFTERKYGYIYGIKEIFEIQDDYDKPNEETKLREIKENMEKAYDEKKMKINYVSAVGTAAGLFGLGWTPEDYANYLNPRVIDFTVNKSVDCVMGIVPFDFFDAMVASPVITNNYSTR